HIFSPTRCLPAEILLKYANDELSKEEIHAVERHLVDCPFCEDALEGMTMAGSENFTAMLDQVNSAIDERVSRSQETEDEATVIDFRTQSEELPAATETESENTPSIPQRNNNGRRWYGAISVAASVMLLAVVGYFMFVRSDLSPQSIATANFEEFPTLINTRGDTPTMTNEGTNLNTQAQMLYADKNYKDAAPLFDQIDSIEAKLYAANCYFRTEQYETAVQRFTEIIRLGDGMLDDAQYGLAMTYLQMDKVTEAKSILEDIVKEKRHGFKTQAAKVLKEVNKL
ncbi:MAG: tetratricopeptide repeat protein, partial [Bacteroidota bacterium]